MRLSCEIIEDLIPLYIDEVCSDKSKEAVADHLKNCDHCREQVYGKKIPIIPEIVPTEEERVLRKTLLKIKQRWWLSVMCIFLIIPMLIMVGFAINEIRGEGMALSNMEEIWKCNRYLTAIRSGNSAKAASFVDFSPYYEECREALAMTPEDHMPNLMETDIGGETWMVQSAFWEKYARMSDPWGSMIESNEIYGLIPLETFLSVTGENREELQGNGYCIHNGICYFLYEDQYLIHEDAYTILSEQDVLLPDCVYMIPAKIYGELEDTLYARAQQWCDSTRARLATVADLDRDEFCAYMENWYCGELERFFAKGLSLEKFGFNSNYSTDNGWNIEYSGTVSQAGDKNRIRVVFHFENNRLTVLFASPGTGTQNHIYDMLTPRFS